MKKLIIIAALIGATAARADGDIPQKNSESVSAAPATMSISSGLYGVFLAGANTSSARVYKPDTHPLPAPYFVSPINAQLAIAIGYKLRFREYAIGLEVDNNFLTAKDSYIEPQAFNSRPKGSVYLKNGTRVRGTVGYSFHNSSIYLSGGRSYFNSKLWMVNTITGFDSSEYEKKMLLGYNFGVGYEWNISDQVRLRSEFIKDIFRSHTYGNSWQDFAARQTRNFHQSTLRFGLVYNL